MNNKSGLNFLLYLHKRLFQQKPQIDILMIFLLTIVSLLVSVGFILRSAIDDSFSRSGSNNVLIVTSKGASNEGESFINELNEGKFMGLLAKNKALKSNKIDLHMVLSTSIKNDNGTVNYVALRGISQNSDVIKNKIKISAGKYFKRGLNEIIVGKSLADTSDGFSIGEKVELATKMWLITGVYTMDGDIRENEFIGDITQIQTRYDANNMINSIRLNGEHEALKGLKSSLEESEIDLDAEIEKEFFAKQSNKISQSLLHLQTIIAFLIIPAAIAGMLSIQRIQVTNLSQQLKTLYLLGFRSNYIWLSLFLRSLTSGFLAFSLAALLIIIFVKDRVVEIDLGFQLTYINFEINVLTFSIIFVVVCGIILISSYFSNLKKILV